MNLHRLRRLFALTGITWVCTPFTATAAADETASGADSIEHPVVVTASREPEDATVALMPVIVIDRDAIEQSLAPDIADLLRFHAGIDIARAGGPGQQTSLFIRGANSNQTVVLVDGVRINPGTLGTPAIQNIAPELVDHIEVVKGPMSTLYGTDAIGGVINVITRRPDGDQLEALVGDGRYNTRQAFASGQYGGPAGSVSLAANYLDSTGFPTLVGSSQDRGFRDDSVNFAGRTSLGGVDLGVRAWHASGTTQYSGDILTPLDQNFETSSYAVDASGPLTGNWRTRVTLSQATDDIRQVQLDTYASPPADDFAITHRNSVDWQNDVSAGAQQITFGGLLWQEHAQTLSFGTAFDVDTYSDTWYVQDRATFGPQRLQAAVGYTHHSVFGDHLTWNAEYGFAPQAGTLLTAGWGTAFRAPDTTDLYGYGGNPALRPESSRNLELGLRQAIGSHQLLTLAAFDNRIDELIEFVDLPTPPTFGQEQNVDRARIRGVEASWEWYSEAWRARLEASRQNPEDLADGTQLLRRARQSATLAIARTLDRSEYSADLLAVGERMDINYPAAVHLGGYALVNLAARFALSPELSLQARLENALDKQYSLVYGYNTMRRSLMVSVRYQHH
ncbi:MAG TPA: TonB-dependent receptor [Steroidobacteraceae bacterium]|nr:TonB-dependent receptor [Steroidobacteraceae bacterium]